MGLDDFIDWIDTDDLFFFKYILIISNFFTIIVLLYFKRPKNLDIKNVLIITAHPDDESMFFIPTIRALQKDKYNIHLLCLSNGNFNNLGKLREIELEKCCKYLNIKHQVVNDPQLPDSQKVQWPIAVIRSHIETYISQNQISGLITFDRGGVSGHANHISCHLAVAEFKDQVKCFQLETTNILRKYISIFDFFISAVGTNWLFVNFNAYVVWKAMSIHYSQFVWFRRLFVIFSRYSFVNTLKQM